MIIVNLYTSSPFLLGIDMSQMTRKGKKERETRKPKEKIWKIPQKKKKKKGEEEEQKTIEEKAQYIENTLDFLNRGEIPPNLLVRGISFSIYLWYGRGILCEIAMMFHQP